MSEAISAPIKVVINAHSRWFVIGLWHASESLETFNKAYGFLKRIILASL